MDSVYMKSAIAEAEKAYAEGVSVGVGVQMAKQYGDMPANLCTPKFMAEECMKLAGSLGLDVTVFDEKAMEKLGMGCLLGLNDRNMKCFRWHFVFQIITIVRKTHYFCQCCRAW